MSADADPYTGVAVSDSTSPECETSYTEGKTKHVLHWCTLGGTSLASPLIASVFALAGGAGGVSYPASTLYANVATTPKDLHDVTSGSNGACGQPFNGSTGVSGCTVEEEAADCASHLICLAATGYDGPTGLGTPDGLAAFEASGAGGGGESPSEETRRLGNARRRLGNPRWRRHRTQRRVPSRRLTRRTLRGALRRRRTRSG